MAENVLPPQISASQPASTGTGPLLDRHVLPPDREFPVTPGAPHVRGFWTTNRIILAIALSLLPCLLEAVYAAGFALLTALAVALVAALGWQALFSHCRGRALSASGVITAVAVVIMLPSHAPLWQIALGVSFGVVVGEQVFGGYGWNFLNPATVALAFLMCSFTSGGYDQGGHAGWVACVPGAMLLGTTGIISWRVIIGAVVSALGMSYVVGKEWPPSHLLESVFAFGLIFLACDPISAPATNFGRWVYGLLIGSFFLWCGAGTMGRTDDMVFACLIGGILAPLIDQVAIWLNIKRRRRRYVEAAR